MIDHGEDKFLRRQPLPLASILLATVHSGIRVTTPAPAPVPGNPDPPLPPGSAGSTGRPCSLRDAAMAHHLRQVHLLVDSFARVSATSAAARPRASTPSTPYDRSTASIAGGLNRSAGGGPPESPLAKAMMANAYRAGAVAPTRTGAITPTRPGAVTPTSPNASSNQLAAPRSSGGGGGGGGSASAPTTPTRGAGSSPGVAPAASTMVKQRSYVAPPRIAEDEDDADEFEDAVDGGGKSRAVPQPAFTVFHARADSSTESSASMASSSGAPRGTSSAYLFDAAGGTSGSVMDSVLSTTAAPAVHDERMLSEFNRSMSGVPESMLGHPMQRQLLLYHMARYLFFAAVESPQPTSPPPEPEVYAGGENKLRATTAPVMLNSDSLETAFTVLGDALRNPNDPSIALAAAIAQWLTGDIEDAQAWFNDTFNTVYGSVDDTLVPGAAIEGDRVLSEWCQFLTTFKCRLERITGDIMALEQTLRKWQHALHSVLRKAHNRKLDEAQPPTVPPVSPASTFARRASAPVARSSGMANAADLGRTLDTLALEQDLEIVTFVRHLVLAEAWDDQGNFHAARLHWLKLFPLVFRNVTPSDSALNEVEDEILEMSRSNLDLAGNLRLQGVAVHRIPPGLPEHSVERLVYHLVQTTSVSYAYNSLLELVSVYNLGLAPFSFLLSLLALSLGRHDAAENYTKVYARKRRINEDWNTMWAPLVSACGLKQVTDSDELAAAVAEAAAAGRRSAAAVNSNARSLSPSRFSLAASKRLGLNASSASTSALAPARAKRTESDFPTQRTHRRIPLDAVETQLLDQLALHLRTHGHLHSVSFVLRNADTACPTLYRTLHGFDVELSNAAGLLRMASRLAFDVNGQFLTPHVLLDQRADTGLATLQDPVVLESVVVPPPALPGSSLAPSKPPPGGPAMYRSLVLWFDTLLIVDTLIDGGNETSVVAEARSVHDVVMEQCKLPKVPPSAAVVSADADDDGPPSPQEPLGPPRVFLEQKYRWTEGVVSLMGNLQWTGAAAEEMEPVNFFVSINLLLPSMVTGGGPRLILTPAKPPTPVPEAYVEFLMDPPRNVFVDNTIRAPLTPAASTVADPEPVKYPPAVGVTMSWETDASTGKRRYTSHVFHIDRVTGTFVPVDVLVNFRVCIALADQWTLGLIPGSRPQIIKLDRKNREMHRVPAATLGPVHPPTVGVPIVSTGGSAKPAKPTPPCALVYWAEVNCVVFVAFTTVVVFAVDTLETVLQLEFSGANNPREAIQESHLTCPSHSASHAVIASGRNVFVLHAPRDDPLAGMSLACFLPLPALPNHVYCEIAPESGAIDMVHVLTSATGGSHYLRFGLAKAPAPPASTSNSEDDNGAASTEEASTVVTVQGSMALAGWNACTTVGDHFLAITDPSGAFLIEARIQEPLAGAPGAGNAFRTIAPVHSTTLL
ncbi:hypothetical protein H9P43_002038 [Blastocladiella emersonii ATCC 22665]|nr:hypothetical protein H9P43_002038 [Blastocladiella emersonii ATCC 22665]